MDSWIRRTILGIILFVAATLVCDEHLAAQSLFIQSDTQVSYEQAAAAAAIRTTASPSGLGLVRFNGRALDETGRPMQGVVGVTFAIYEEQSGGAPLWQETQNLTADANGRFSALLGAASPTGVPTELFSSGDARWLAVLAHSPGVSEQPRILLVSVPYALQAANAGTLGGLPASAFARADSVSTANKTPEDSIHDGLGVRETIKSLALGSNGAIPGYLAVFTDANGDVGNSPLFEAANGNVGIGTNAPNALLHGISANGVSDFRFNTGAAGQTPTMSILNTNPGGKAGAFIAGTNGAGFAFDASGYFTILSETHANIANNNAGQGPSLFTILGSNGHAGIGTTTPDQMLTVAGSIHSTTGGFIFPDGSVMRSAATLPGLQPNGNLILGAGTSAGGAGNLDLQTSDDGTNTMSDRLLIVGKPKAMTGPVPMANLFSVHIPAGDAAGGRVKFTIVASDGTHYAMETGEMIFLASPNQVTCAVVVSEYAAVPPTYTNTVLASPPIGQVGSLNAQCSSTTFGGDPGILIFDTMPTSFVPTTHKVYYTIENQSQAALTLQS